MLREIKVMGGNQKNPLNEAEKEYIRQNIGKAKIADMVRHLKRSGKTIYDFVRLEEIKKLDGSKDTRKHPWRKANNMLEHVKSDSGSLGIVYKSGRKKR